MLNKGFATITIVLKINLHMGDFYWVCSWSEDKAKFWKYFCIQLICSLIQKVSPESFPATLLTSARTNITTVKHHVLVKVITPCRSFRRWNLCDCSNADIHLSGTPISFTALIFLVYRTRIPDPSPGTDGPAVSRGVWRTCFRRPSVNTSNFADALSLM